MFFLYANTNKEHKIKSTFCLFFVNDGKPIENAYEYICSNGEVLLFAINKYYEPFNHTDIMPL